MKSNLFYRMWQFWQSLKKPPKQGDWAEVRSILTPPEMELFEQLPVPDQNHSLRVLRNLTSAGERDEDLLKAALLHDIGKTRHTLSRWERVFAVLLAGLLPNTSARWGEKAPRGLYRPLVVIHQHPIWGAELVKKAGSSRRVVWLIRHHEEQDLTGLFDRGGVELLRKLQLADNVN